MQDSMIELFLYQILWCLHGVVSRLNVVAWSSVRGGRVNWGLRGVVSRGRIVPEIMNKNSVKLYEILLPKTDIYLGASVTV